MHGKSQKLRKTVAVIAGMAAAGLATAVTLTGYRKGRSARAQAVIALLWATRRRRKFETVEHLRAAIAQNRTAGPVSPPMSLTRGWDVSKEHHQDVRFFHVRPKNSEPKGTILYIHGGGYVFDLVGPHWSIIGALAGTTGAQVIVPIYPLAPEATFKEGFAFLESLWPKLTGAGAKVAIAGDSAGGGLTLALAQRIRDAGLTKPAALLLFSPWLNVQIDDPLQAEIQLHDPMLYVKGLREAGTMWAGKEDLRSPQISPIFGDMSDLPPIAIFTGSSDILLSDARRLRDRLAAASLPVEYHEYEGMFHVWVGAPVPEARKALNEAAAFLLQQLSRPS